jgi:hypothetical protein
MLILPTSPIALIRIVSGSKIVACLASKANFETLSLELYRYLLEPISSGLNQSKKSSS